VGRAKEADTGRSTGKVTASRRHSTVEQPSAASEGLFELDRVSEIDPEEVITPKPRRGSVGNLSSFQRSADRFPPLSGEQQLQLVARHREILGKIERAGGRGRERNRVSALQREADGIVEHLCASCWRLAWVIVREQAEERFGRDRASEMLPDLLSEANLALVKAVLEFDPTRTPKFATYAARVMRDHTRAVLSRDGYMKLAPSWSRVKRLASTRLPEMTHELGRRPSIEELQADLLERCVDWALDHLTDSQKRLGMTQRRKLAMAKLRKQGMLGAIRDIEDVLIASQTMISLDTPLGDDSSMTLGDGIVAGTGDDGFMQVEQDELHQVIMSALGSLNEREREIVLLRYGFNGGEGETYSTIAEKFGVSSERIRQIERGALEKLADPANGFAGLASYLHA